MRDITLGDTFIHAFTTRAFASGVPTVLAGTPVLSVLEGGNATPITAGVSVSVDRASVVGLNEATIIATSGNGYETGKNYVVYISTGTVGGVSVVGEVVGHFTVEQSSAFIRAGAPAGASVSADIAAIKAETVLIVADTNELQTDNIPGSLATAQNDLDIITGSAGAIIDDSAANDTTISDAVWDEDATGHQTTGTFGKAIGDPVANTETIYDAVVTDAAGINVATDVVAVKAETVLIVADTNELQTDDVPTLIANLDTVVDRVETDTQNIQSRLPTALVNSRMDSTIDATGFEAAAVDLIWDETMAGHTTADTSGLLMNEWQDGGRLDVILDAIVGDTDLIDDGTSGLAKIATDVAAVLVDTGTTLQAELDGIQADTENIQTRLPSALVSGKMDSDVEAINDSAPAAVNLGKSTLQIISGAAEGTPSTTVIQTDLAETQDDIYIGRTVIFTSGNAKDEATDITDYTGATGTLTVTALANAPAALDTFIII